ncbi:MAG: hypothetical protein U5M23_02985 [Marinagarivorans sp.]|nr:hypothetical protein [Marinagarivorans sp.]
MDQLIALVFRRYGGRIDEREAFDRSLRSLAQPFFARADCLTGLVHDRRLAVLDDTMIEHAWLSTSTGPIPVTSARRMMTVLDHLAAPTTAIIPAGMSFDPAIDLGVNRLSQ